MWTLISKYFTHGLRELSLLTQKVDIPHLHFSPTFVKFKKGVYFAHLFFWGGGAKICEKETKNFDFLVSCHRLTFRRISKNDNNPMLRVFV